MEKLKYPVYSIVMRAFFPIVHNMYEDGLARSVLFLLNFFAVILLFLEIIDTLPAAGASAGIASLVVVHARCELLVDAVLRRRDSQSQGFKVCRLVCERIRWRGRDGVCDGEGLVAR
jgi:hypothetical protein